MCKRVVVTTYMMQSEAEFFKNAVRAQLNTTGRKPCTYFATTVSDEKLVFVKGPYETKEDAMLQQKVAAFKHLMCPSLPIIDYYAVELRVDKKFLNCQYGARTSFTSPTGFFLVCQDLLQPYVDGPLPTRMASSVMWADPVQVVDFDKVEHVFQHVWYFNDYAKSMYATHPKVARQYVLHVLFSWVCGCGADLARRNFFIKGDAVYQIDLEAWADFTWVLADSAPGSKRTKAGAQLYAFVSNDWSYFEPFFRAALASVRAKCAEFCAMYDAKEKDVDEMVKRLEGMQTLEGTLEAITRETSRKRKAPDVAGQKKKGAA